jgi:hypothetical protein
VGVVLEAYWSARPRASLLFVLSVGAGYVALWQLLRPDFSRPKSVLLDLSCTCRPGGVALGIGVCWRDGSECAAGMLTCLYLGCVGLSQGATAGLCADNGDLVLLEVLQVCVTCHVACGCVCLGVWLFVWVRGRCLTEWGMGEVHILFVRVVAECVCGLYGPR